MRRSEFMMGMLDSKDLKVAQIMEADVRGDAQDVTAAGG